MSANGQQLEMIFARRRLWCGQRTGCSRTIDVEAPQKVRPTETTQFGIKASGKVGGVFSLIDLRRIVCSQHCMVAKSRPATVQADLKVFKVSDLGILFALWQSRRLCSRLRLSRKAGFNRWGASGMQSRFRAFYRGGRCANSELRPCGLVVRGASAECEERHHNKQAAHRRASKRDCSPIVGRVSTGMPFPVYSLSTAAREDA